mmetsp:Transcript_22951/g.50328  ORF Transcript_22951/g.50328 Transcript_22951/m.50328 type:complete len:281 (-) Transcript_22951:158-1000(-)
MRVSHVLFIFVAALLLCQTQAGGYKKTLSKNLAIALSQKWIVQRCIDQQAKFQQENKMFIKLLNGRVQQVTDFGVTNNRKLLEAAPKVDAGDEVSSADERHAQRRLLETITAAELEERMEQRRKDKSEYERLAHANFTRAHNWAKKNEYEDYWQAATMTEKYCTNSTMDRGPTILSRDMPPEIYDYMLEYHRELGGCDINGGCRQKGAASTAEAAEASEPSEPLDQSVVGPSIAPEPAPQAAEGGSSCPPISRSVDLITVMLSLLVGVGIGIAGTLYVLR